MNWLIFKWNNTVWRVRFYMAPMKELTAGVWVKEIDKGLYVVDKGE